MIRSGIVISTPTRHERIALPKNTNQSYIPRSQEGISVWADFTTMSKFSFSVAQEIKAKTHEKFLEHHGSTSLETNWHCEQWVHRTLHTRCCSARCAQKLSVSRMSSLEASRCCVLVTYRSHLFAMQFGKESHFVRFSDDEPFDWSQWWIINNLLITTWRLFDKLRDVWGIPNNKPLIFE